MLGVAPRRRVQPAEGADEDGPLAPVELEAGQLGVMLEGRRAVAGGGRLGHPELDGVDLLGPGRVLLGVGDPVAGGHEVQLPRPDQLLGAQAVQVEQLAGHQPGHGLQAQVRMRPDAERPTRLGPDGADVIDEAPGPHRAARPLRQDPAHRQSSPPGSGGPGRSRRPGPRPGPASRAPAPRRRWRPVRSSGSFLHLYGGGRHRTRPTGRPHPMTIPAADDAVVDDTAGSRFVISEGGAEAELLYVIEGDRMLLVHTEVPEAWGGRGIGGRLVRAALARAQANGLTVVPWCPFARRWLQEHPDEAAAVTIDWETPRPSF